MTTNMQNFLTPEEELRPWGEAEKKDEENALMEKEKKSGIPYEKLPEQEPLEKIFVPRRDWGAGPHAEGHTYLQKPIVWVRFWKYTDTQSCTNKDFCKKIVKEIQERHKQSGFIDITHNFLFGGDGNVYEGRGWDHKAPKDTRYKHDKKNYLDIAFIGDERNTMAFYDAAYELFNNGFINKYIDKEYFHVEWGQESTEKSLKQIP